MPVVGGRKHEYLNSTYGGHDTSSVTKNAPFGNNNSQLQRVKIVGGQRLYVKEDPNWPEKAKKSVQHLHPCSPIARTWSKQLTKDHIPLSPPPIPENINKFDLTNYWKERSKTSQSHGDAAIPKTTQPQVPATTKATLNPHPVLPPIDETLDRITAQTACGDSAECLATYIPSSTYLAPHAITLSKQDELLLKQRIGCGLGTDFKSDRLKEVYNELVEYDEDLTGYVAYTNIGYALLRSQVHLSVMDLRLLCSMYVSTTDARKVNYEKVLSFIAACFNSMGDRSGRKTGHDEAKHWINSDKSLATDNPSLTTLKLASHEGRDSEDKDTKHQFSMQDDEVDFSIIRQMFSNADVHKRGTLTRMQMLILSLAAGINMKEHEINQIMDKYERGNFRGSYNWEPYLDELERTAGQNSKETLISPRNTSQSMKSLKSKAQSTDSNKQDTHSETHKDRRTGNKRLKSSPWFDRFMKMAKAFYLVDADSTGHLPFTNAKWLVEEYNSVYNLAIPSDQIEAAVKESSLCEQGKDIVGIDNLLRQLIKFAP